MGKIGAEERERKEMRNGDWKKGVDDREESHVS